MAGIRPSILQSSYIQLMLLNVEHYTLRETWTAVYLEMTRVLAIFENMLCEKLKKRLEK